MECTGRDSPPASLGARKRLLCALRTLAPSVDVLTFFHKGLLDTQDYLRQYHPFVEKPKTSARKPVRVDPRNGRREKHLHSRMAAPQRRWPMREPRVCGSAHTSKVTATRGGERASIKETAQGGPHTSGGFWGMRVTAQLSSQRSCHDGKRKASDLKSHIGRGDLQRSTVLSKRKFMVSELLRDTCSRQRRERPAHGLAGCCPHAFLRCGSLPSFVEKTGQPL